MDLHLKPIEPRSHSASPSFMYLRVLLSISTSSVGGLLLLGENPVQAYPVQPNSESVNVNAIDITTVENEIATIETIESVDNSENSGDLYEFDLRFIDSNNEEFQAEPDIDSKNEIRFVRSTLISEFNHSDLEQSELPSLDSSTVDFTDESLQAFFQTEDEQTDWVAWFDHVQAVSQEAPETALDSATVSESSNHSANQSEAYETNAAALLAEPLNAQSIESAVEPIVTESEQPIDLAPLTLNLQGVYLLQGDESSARARLSGSYAFTPNVLLGATLDLTTGDAFTNSPEDGFDLNELFVTVSPSTVPNLSFTVGMFDLTSYFDRNSFAKDAATHFFNPVFQTNPALAAAGLGSRPGILVNWDVVDNLILRGAAFSSDRDLGDFTFDSAAAEVGVRLGNAIIRGTYVNSRDAGRQSGFREIFQFERGNDAFGILSGDREVAYGVNAEVFIPEVNMGLFARYGWYENQTLGRNGNTYSFGANLLDLFFADDRLGLAYGRELSNNSLRRDRGDEIPDVFEAFYDVRLTPNLRAGVTLQGRDAWSETVLGLRVRADLNLAGLWR
ncbi:hypothetical protein C7B61_17560 [filamentous cyanobacterium CCP1]|nr:hypothetical protein C7B61_17560 [filamentous cyanobacterium CCP1]